MSSIFVYITFSNLHCTENKTKLITILKEMSKMQDDVVLVCIVWKFSKSPLVLLILMYSKKEKKNALQISKCSLVLHQKPLVRTVGWVYFSPSGVFFETRYPCISQLSKRYLPCKVLRSPWACPHQTCTPLVHLHHIYCLTES